MPARNALVAIPCPIAPIPSTATGPSVRAIGLLLSAIRYQQYPIALDRPGQHHVLAWLTDGEQIGRLLDIRTDSFSPDPDFATDGRRARGEASRQAILDATVRVIAAGGLPSVNHRAVAVEAGVSTALTTYHFATLDDLLQATLSSLTAKAIARLSTVGELAELGAITLADAATAFLTGELGSNRDVFIANLELQFASVRRPAWARAMTNTHAAFVTLIQHYVDDEDAARAIFSAAFGFAVLHVIEGSHPSDATCRRFVEDLLTHYDVPKPSRPRSKRTGRTSDEQ
jgi:DNA-binding transcriptional regulator YbjK